MGKSDLAGFALLMFLKEELSYNCKINMTIQDDDWDIYVRSTISEFVFREDAFLKITPGYTEKILRVNFQHVNIPYQVTTHDFESAKREIQNFINQEKQMNYQEISSIIHSFSQRSGDQTLFVSLQNPEHWPKEKGVLRKGEKIMHNGAIMEGPWTPRK